MNCKKCGHPADHHGYDGCMYPHKPDEIGDEYECLCNLTQEEIERNAWKNEALAAREYIKFLSDNLRWGMHTDEWEMQENNYLVAKVEQPQP